MKTRDIPIGAKVTFRIAGNPVAGRVLEDRGPIGVGGRHLYTVRYELGKGNWYSMELPAADLDSIEFKPVNSRRRRALGYIVPVDASEGYSLFAKPKHARPLAEFLRARGVRFTEDSDAIPGEVFILVDKGIPWEEFVELLYEWKQQYAEG